VIGRCILITACIAIIVACTAVTLRTIKGRDVCGAVDANARATRALIINGVKNSRSFEKLIVENGGKPYAQRLEQAYRDADSLPGCP